MKRVPDMRMPKASARLGALAREQLQFAASPATVLPVERPAPMMGDREDPHVIVDERVDHG